MEYSALSISNIVFSAFSSAACCIAIVYSINHYQAVFLNKEKLVIFLQMIFNIIIMLGFVFENYF